MANENPGKKAPAATSSKARLYPAKAGKNKPKRNVSSPNVQSGFKIKKPITADEARKRHVQRLISQAKAGSRVVTGKNPDPMRTPLMFIAGYNHPVNTLITLGGFGAVKRLSKFVLPVWPAQKEVSNG